MPILNKAAHIATPPRCLHHLPWRGKREKQYYQANDNSCYAALPPLLMSIRSLPETLGGRLFYQQKVVGSGKPQKAGYSFSRRVECVLAM